MHSLLSLARYSCEVQASGPEALYLACEQAGSLLPSKTLLPKKALCDFSYSKVLSDAHLPFSGPPVHPLMEKRSCSLCCLSCVWPSCHFGRPAALRWLAHQYQLPQATTQCICCSFTKQPQLSLALPESSVLHEWGWPASGKSRHHCDLL